MDKVSETLPRQFPQIRKDCIEIEKKYFYDQDEIERQLFIMVVDKYLHYYKKTYFRDPVPMMVGRYMELDSKGKKAFDEANEGWKLKKENSEYLFKYNLNETNNLSNELYLRDALNCLRGDKERVDKLKKVYFEHVRK